MYRDRVLDSSSFPYLLFRSGVSQISQRLLALESRIFNYTCQSVSYSAPKSAGILRGKSTHQHPHQKRSEQTIARKSRLHSRQ